MIRNLYKKLTDWYYVKYIRPGVLKNIAEFEKVFPDKCYYCSRYRFARDMGWEKGLTPLHKPCKENNAAGYSKEHHES